MNALGQVHIELVLGRIFGGPGGIFDSLARFNVPGNYGWGHLRFARQWFAHKDRICKNPRALFAVHREPGFQAIGAQLLHFVIYLIADTLSDLLAVVNDFPVRRNRQGAI